MWIKTQRGGLVNLDNVASIDAYEVVYFDRPNQWSVRATLVNGAVRTVRSELETEAIARLFIDLMSREQCYHNGVVQDLMQAVDVAREPAY